MVRAIKQWWYWHKRGLCFKHDILLSGDIYPYCPLCDMESEEKKAKFLDELIQRKGR